MEQVLPQDLASVDDPGDVNDFDDRDELLLTPSRNSFNPLARYVTTSSAKKKKVKETDCKFCHSNLTGKEFFTHLESRKYCRILYMKLSKVKSFEKLVVKIFSCEMCHELKKMDLKKHLRKNISCFKKYQRKFGVTDLEIIHKKVMALRRSTTVSRSIAARKLETAKRQSKLIEDNRKKTVTSSINDYRDSIMLSNYRLCISCRSNFGEYSARQVKDGEELFETLNLDDSDTETRNLRRFGKFFICNNCNKGPREDEDNLDKVAKIGEVSAGDTIMFFPEDNEVDGNTEVQLTRIDIMLPISSGAIEEGQKKFNPDSDIIRKVFENKPIKKSTLAGIYDIEAKKYQQVLVGGDKFTATIKDNDSKTLAHVEKIQSVIRVTGSDQWYRTVAEDMKHRQEQFGSLFLTVKLDLPQTKPEIIATCLLQEGFVITVDKLGSCTGEYKIVYKVHLDHNNEKDCDKECLNKVDLKEYLDDVGFNYFDLGNKYVGTYVNSVHQKLTSFARCIVQAPSSGLFSENFFLMVVFNSSGEASIIGAIWPEVLDVINLEISEHNGQLKNKRNLIEFVEKNFSAMKDSRLLRSAFNLSEDDANYLSSLVHEHQFHICNDEDCSSCSSSELPSLETDIKQPCSNYNLEASKDLVKIMKEKLKTMSMEDKKTLSTSSWLDNVWQEVSGELSENMEFLTVLFHEEEVKIQFEIDEDLTESFDKYDDSPLTAVYHYAISRSVEHHGEAVLKRLWIADSFTQTYNPFILKANSPSVVKLSNSTNYFESLLFGERRTEIVDGIDPKLYFTHKLVSLAEAVFLTDKTKKKIVSSTTVEFVNAKPNRKVTFKKVYEPSEENFQLQGSFEQYQLVDSNISRHFKRQNGNLILAETCSWYDYVGSEKSKELSMTYASSEIPGSETECVCGDETLPAFIICTNGDVLKKRKKMKVLTFPKPRSKYDEMYSKCLLFLPIMSEEELLDQNLEERFGELNEEGDKSIVRYNEQKFFKMKVFETSSVREPHEEDLVNGEDALDCLLEALEDEVVEEAIDVEHHNEEQTLNSETVLDCLI